MNRLNITNSCKVHNNEIFFYHSGMISASIWKRMTKNFVLDLFMYSNDNLRIDRLCKILVMFCLTVPAWSECFAQSLPLQLSYRYESGTFNQAAVGHHAFDPVTRHFYFVDSAAEELRIFDLQSDIAKPLPVASVDLSTYAALPGDVVAHGNVVAVAFTNVSEQSRGRIVFFDSLGQFLNRFDLGAAPQQLSLVNNGQYLLSANAAYPSDDYNFDPRGSVSIVRILSATPDRLTQNDVLEIDFQRYDTVNLDKGVRVYGNQGQQSPSQDLEPQEIAVDEQAFKAYISLQENNAIAVVDYFFAQLDTIFPLPLKSRANRNQAFSGTDRGSTVSLDSFPGIFSLYQPRGLSFLRQAGQSYLLSANEGAARDYPAYSEIATIASTPLDPVSIPNARDLKIDTILGPLKITNTIGGRGVGLLYDSAVSFGGRSFSVWDSLGQLIFDSGDDFERTILSLEAANFNSSAISNQSFKARGPWYGPQPNAIVTGEVDGSLYAFISLRQMGGVMIYNLNNPRQPIFDSYLLNRNFSVAADVPQAGDLGPVELSFVSGDRSPNGQALLIVSHSISGSLSIYELGQGIGLREYRPGTAPEIFPNPSTGIFHYQGVEKLQIFNSEGKFIKEVLSHETIDLSAESPGIYLVKNRSGRTVRLLKI